MTDPLYGLHTLLELPPSQPPPVEGLRRRVEARRRRRRVTRSSLAGAAVVLAGVAAVPLVDRPSDDPTQVVAAATGSPTLALEADKDCAYLRLRAGDPPLAGGCPAGPPDHSVQTYWPAVPVGDGSNATIVRGGPAMARFVARLADGRTVEGALGAHGWALVVTDGRLVGVSGVDGQGHPVPEWIVR